MQIQTGSVKLNPEIIKILPHASIGAFEARPVDPAQIRGGLVVIQEIFGVNQHIQAVCKQYASQGYWVIAPALFDHVEPSLDLKYEGDDWKKGYGMMLEIGFDQFFADSKAAGIELNHRLATLPGAKRKAAVVGYCLGGSLVWALSCQTNGIFQAGSAYYGSQVLKMMDAKPNNPVILHFGEKDEHIPVSEVKEFSKQHPASPVYLYPADHGFNCMDRSAYDAASAELAEKRTLDFFAKTIG
jgi:carboxymethylenebutenolidase